jgi:hypothetical protein
MEEVPITAVKIERYERAPRTAAYTPRGSVGVTKLVDKLFEPVDNARSS